MKVTNFVVEVAVTAIAAVLAAGAVTWLWNVFAHGTPLVDWATSVRLAILLGVSLPVTRRVARRRRCA